MVNRPRSPDARPDPAPAPVGARAPPVPAARVRRSRAQVAGLAAAAVVVAALAGAGLRLWQASRERAASAAPSVAVVPFANASGDPAQDYLSDGIAEEIQGALSRVPGLRVAGRTSSFSPQTRSGSARQAGRDLHASSVLEGSVHRKDSRIRVAARLVDVESGAVAWGQEFDREFADVIEIEEEVASAVATALRLRVAAGGLRPVHDRGADPAAYATFLEGRHHFLKGGIDGYRAAAERFRRAVEIDPSLTGAWTGLAVASSIPSVSTPEESARSCARALEAADRALGLDPRWGVAWVTRGAIRKACTRDLAGARADILRGAALDPGNAIVRLHAGWSRLEDGRAREALEDFRVATELDPLSSAAWSGLGYGRMVAGDLPGATAALRRAQTISPREGSTALALGMVALLAGDVAGADAELSRLPEDGDQPWRVALLGRSLGRPEEALRARDEIVRQFGDDAPFSLAEVHAWNGDADGALYWLERAVQRNDRGIAALRYWPLLDPIRGDPRLSALVERVNAAAP